MAEKAEIFGLVHQVVQRESLDTEVEKQIAAYLRCAPGAVAATKRLIDYVDRHDTVANFHYTVDRVAEMWASDEAAEGIDSFLQKRKPSWVPT
jgi:methylglutaconyl-CoA hydratase